MNDTELVVAAQAGDRKALDDLVSLSLPLVYSIVRRALSADPDADDVVQEIMLRALRQLAELRTPESFRPWLAAIAVRQISTHLHRTRVVAGRTAPLDDVIEYPDADAEVEGVTVLRAELSHQRRQIVRASRWLDPDDRALLSLWWLETAGQLTRPELATALGVSVAHAGVRVQRMRGQLDLSRSVVAALDARSGCAGLAAALAEWDGHPDPLWRKRIARHTRNCAECTGAATGMVPAERLLVGFALLPVPLTVTAALIGKGVLTGTATGTASAAASTAVPGGAAVGGKAGLLLGQLVQAVAAHPIIAAAAAGVLIVGGAIATTTLPPSEPSAPGAVAAPTSAPAGTPSPPPAPASPGPTSAGTLAPGRVSLESANAPGRFVATAEFLGVLATVGPDTDGDLRTRATFEVVPGRANPTCFSFRTQDGWYLRHSSWRIRLSMDQGTSLFRGDATFCARPGSVAGSVSLESSNYPGWFLRHRGDELWVDRSDGGPAFRADSSFRVRAPAAR